MSDVRLALSVHRGDSIVATLVAHGSGFTWATQEHERTWDDPTVAARSLAGILDPADHWMRPEAGYRDLDGPDAAVALDRVGGRAWRISGVQSCGLTRSGRVQRAFVALATHDATWVHTAYAADGCEHHYLRPLTRPELVRYCRRVLTADHLDQQWTS